MDDQLPPNHDDLPPLGLHILALLVNFVPIALIACFVGLILGAFVGWCVGATLSGIKIGPLVCVLLAAIHIVLNIGYFILLHWGVVSASTLERPQRKPERERCLQEPIVGWEQWLYRIYNVCSMASVGAAGVCILIGIAAVVFRVSEWKAGILVATGGILGSAMGIFNPVERQTDASPHWSRSRLEHACDFAFNIPFGLAIGSVLGSCLFALCGLPPVIGAGLAGIVSIVTGFVHCREGIAINVERHRARRLLARVSEAVLGGALTGMALAWFIIGVGFGVAPPGESPPAFGAFLVGMIFGGGGAYDGLFSRSEQLYVPFVDRLCSGLLLGMVLAAPFYIVGPFVARMYPSFLLLPRLAAPWAAVLGALVGFGLGYFRGVQTTLDRSPRKQLFDATVAALCLGIVSSIVGFVAIWAFDSQTVGIVIAIIGAYCGLLVGWTRGVRLSASLR